MRPAVALVVAIAIAVAVYVGMGRSDNGASRTGAATLVGDSLNVGIEPYLGRALKSWKLTFDDVVGRSTDEGITALEQRASSLAPIIVVSLGTNDDQSDVEGFRRRVRKVVDLTGPGVCIVWATIHRDAQSDALNDVLTEEAVRNRNLVVVEWAEMVADDRTLLAEDGIHATPTGYERRADAVKAAIERCPRGNSS
jgi:lysophospholipase L1-like esterase